MYPVPFPAVCCFFEVLGLFKAICGLKCQIRLTDFNYKPDLMLNRKSKNFVEILKQVLYDKSGESREPRSRKRKKDTFSVFYDSTETKSPAMELAEEIRANLEEAYPSFAKTLVRSNVTVGFWMHLPMRFCKMHLPKNDTTVFLENEKPDEKDVQGGKKAKHLELLPAGHLEENIQENGLIVVDNNKGYAASQSENESEDRASETWESSNFPDPLLILIILKALIISAFS
ncbi:hypothetical protein POTOM_017580 [Populus tomentosa]|uniref:Uncharacterized protein n=1 Tax=Populus tomentosa TaxID=118781 RepID=A0A8X7ZXD0_POPTO|nr:hypothetical protein POTOM_017580 [Populus tomentosa]